MRPGSDGHPLGLRFIQMMVYLTDCDDDTHCISFCPESLLQSDPTLICLHKGSIYICPMLHTWS